MDSAGGKGMKIEKLLLTVIDVKDGTTCGACQFYDSDGDWKYCWLFDVGMKSWVGGRPKECITEFANGSLPEREPGC
jgi:hypothetical protein